MSLIRTWAPQLCAVSDARFQAGNGKQPTRKRPRVLGDKTITGDTQQQEGAGLHKGGPVTKKQMVTAPAGGNIVQAEQQHMPSFGQQPAASDTGSASEPKRRRVHANNACVVDTSTHAAKPQPASTSTSSLNNHYATKQSTSSSGTSGSEGNSVATEEEEDEQQQKVVQEHIPQVEQQLQWQHLGMHTGDAGWVHGVEMQPQLKGKQQYGVDRHMDMNGAAAKQALLFSQAAAAMAAQPSAPTTHHAPPHTATTNPQSTSNAQPTGSLVAAAAQAQQHARPPASLGRRTVVVEAGGAKLQVDASLGDPAMMLSRLRPAVPRVEDVRKMMVGKQGTVGRKGVVGKQGAVGKKGVVGKKGDVGARAAHQAGSKAKHRENGNDNNHNSNTLVQQPLPSIINTAPRVVTTQVTSQPSAMTNPPPAPIPPRVAVTDTPVTCGSGGSSQDAMAFVGQAATACAPSPPPARLLIQGVLLWKCVVW